MIEMMKGVFSLAKESPFKLVIILAIVSCLTGFVVWYHSELQQSGYNQCLVDQEKAEEKSEAEQLAALREEIEAYKIEKAKDKAALKSANEQIDNLEKIHGDIDYEIRNYEAPEVPEDCPDSDRVDAEFYRLFIQPIKTKPAI